MTLRTIYIILQIIGVIILMFELFYVLIQKPSKLQRNLIIILFSLIFGFIAYAIELGAKSLDTAVIGCVLGYVGKPFAFLACLFLLKDYAHIKVSRKISYSIIIYFVVLTSIVFTTLFTYTSDTPGLYYSSISFDEVGKKIGSPLIIGHGIFWYVYMASTFILYGFYVALIIYEYKNSKTKQVKQMTSLLFWMMCSSIIGLILFILPGKLTYGYDTTLFGTLVGSIFLLILLTKYRIFDSLTLAKDENLNTSKNGLVVLDAKLNISYFNNKAVLFSDDLKTYKTHEEENRIIDELDRFEVNKPIFREDRVFFLITKEFRSTDGTILYGKSYSFEDKTDEYYYSKRLQEDVDEATTRIIQIQKDILLGIADIIEQRDGCTGKHVKNVARNAKLISKELAKKEKFKNTITKEYITMIEDTMPLHDVGKIKISDIILNKPGKLTPEEFEIIKTHTTIGADIIKNTITNVENSSKVDMAKDIALHHHEWFNGTGYPEGLKGEDIPLCARIAAVSDVYDALRSVRPYKGAYSKEEAIEIIKKESGSHFDPEVVEAFIKIVDKLN